MSGLGMFVGHCDSHYHIMSVCLKPSIPFILTPTLAHEIHIFQNKLAEKYYRAPWGSVNYVFWHLHAGKIKWKGFDFKYIHDALKNQNSAALAHYLDEVFDLLFLNYVGLDILLINCSIVNRPIQGISHDFFFVNQISFIKKNGKENSTANRENNIIPVNIDNYSNKLSFPRKIYTRNKYYEYHHMNLSVIRKLIELFSFNSMTQDKLQESKLIFEELKENTINTLYQIASKNLQLIERLAYLQSKRKIP